MINRHNYEEHFLLYADDELNHQQRAAVELFVLENPDLAEELETLQQMKLVPDEGIVFPDKALLYRTSKVDINLNNYEEFFLLYVDRELDAQARETVERFVLQHPELQDEFTLLKQTVLQPEAIIFANKSVLYKREERKIGYVRFIRLAVAAAVIGLVALGWWMYPKHQPTGGKGITETVVEGSETKSKKGQTATNPPVKATDTSTIAKVDEATKNKKASVADAVVKGGAQNSKQPQAATKSTNNFDVPQHPTNNMPIDQPVVVSHSPDIVDTTAPRLPNVVAILRDNGNTGPTTAVQVTSIDNSNLTKPSANPAGQEVVAAIAQPIAYKELDVSEDEDHSMYIGSLDLNKDKIKGFLKRAGRFFGARSKKDVD